MIKILTTKDMSATLYHEKYNACYHSVYGAMQESNHVFIQNGFLHISEGFKDINILEVGMGTGMNCFLTYLEFRKRICTNMSVNYYAVEKYPLNNPIIEQLATTIPFVKNQEVFLNLHSENKKIVIHQKFILYKILEDIKQALEQIQESTIHLVYYDAFAPSVQPEMWQKEIFEKIHQKMQKNAILVTFCAKGQFKRDLRSIGFCVETLRGAVGKREMTRAIKI